MTPGVRMKRSPMPHWLERADGDASAAVKSLLREIGRESTSPHAVSMLEAFIGIEASLERVENRLSGLLWEGTRDWLGQRSEYRRSVLVSRLDSDAADYFRPHAALMRLCATGDCFPLEGYIDTARCCEVPQALIEPLRSVCRFESAARRGVFMEMAELLAELSSKPSRHTRRDESATVSSQMTLLQP